MLFSGMRPEGKSYRFPPCQTRLNFVISILEEAIFILDGLHILSIAPESKELRIYKIHSSFAASLRHALSGSGPPGCFGDPCSDVISTVTDSVLDNWARSQWEAILYYMVGTAGAEVAQDSNMTRATNSMIELLKYGQFVSQKGNRVNITKDGFSFLLQETNAQVWSWLICYFNKGEEVSRRELLSIII
jgi:transcription initiation factor TFIIH subunit 4